MTVSHRSPVPDPSVGDWPAFEELVRERYGQLCASAYRYVGSTEAAEDIVHDVLLRTWMRRDEAHPKDLLAYLFGSVRNAAISALRQARAEGARDERLAFERCTGHDESGDAVVHAHLTQAVTAAIDQLPERCRLIFLLHRDSGLSYREIADRLGLSVKTVETQMGRALKALRLRLAPYLSVSVAVLGSGIVKRLFG